MTDKLSPISQRFRHYLPVVVDVETAGFNPKTDALLEIACIPILIDDNGKFYAGEAINAHLEPFEGANLEKRALEFTGIRVDSPLRQAIAEDEKTAIKRIFKHLKNVRQATHCTKCILVGHNAHFDLGFLNAMIDRTHTKIKPISSIFGIRHGNVIGIGVWADGTGKGVPSRRH